MQEALVFCDNLIKIYKTDDLEVVALQGLDLEVSRGEMIAIVGASGSGKSTLMNILGGLDVPSAGKAVVAGYDLLRLSEEQRTRYCNLIIGHVWQQSGRNLFSDLSVIDNVELPQLLNGVGSGRARKRAMELLDIVGLAHMAKKKPIQLSGGEQQRVALAVALSNKPLLLLADEPTGELDTQTTQEIMQFMRQINQQMGITMLLVTHDVSVAAQMDRTLAIRDGRTSTETVRREQGGNGTNGYQSSAIIGLSNETHQESIFVDRVGLLQLPADVVERLQLRGRAEVRILDDHVEIRSASRVDDESVYDSQDGKSAIIGLSLRSHREFVLIDRAGRVQLPKEAMDRVSFNGRAEVRALDAHVELWPAQVGNRL